MKKLAIGLLLSVTTLSFGCNKDGAKENKSETNGNGAIAVVNLDTVAKAMGWQDEMNRNLEQTKASVLEQLRGVLVPSQNALKAKIDEIKKANNLSAAQMTQLDNAKNRSDLEALGLTAKQIDELGQASAVVSQLSAGAQQRFQQEVSLQQNKIINAYREAVKPSVRRVAMDNHKTAVFMPSPEVLYSDPGADLSDKVVDDLQHTNAAKVELPPIPKLQIEMPPATTAPAKK